MKLKTQMNKSMTLLFLAPFFLFSCKAKEQVLGGSSDEKETAQQVGDVMAALDESSGSSSGTISQWNQTLERESRAFARLEKISSSSSLYLQNLGLRPAWAGDCGASTFSSCVSNQIVRTFGGCSPVAGVTLSGTVTLTYSDASIDNVCSLASTGHSVTRVPDFTITGPRGGSLTVSKVGSFGQKLTRTSSGFNFENDGIRRVYNGSLGGKFDFKTQTLSPLTFTGTSRNQRTLSGGSLRVTNQISGVTCDFTPSNIKWTSSCTCPTEGSWSASCSDGRSGTLSISSCGQGSYSLSDGSSEALTFDRCASQ